MARFCCCCSCWLMMMMVVVVLFIFFEGGEAYKNYTVGGSLGWYDNLQVPKADYQKWADGSNFTLGDFLFFNTDMNHSVVQTYNLTTYKSCDFSGSAAADTTEWSNGDPSAANNAGVTVVVPLLKEGQTYFFSSDYDGEQCKHGQHFKITVSHGQGLPPSLRPPDSSPGPNSADYASSTPDTTVPSNFDTPKETDDDGTTVKATSADGGVQAGLWRRSMGVVIVVVLLKFVG